MENENMEPGTGRPDNSDMPETQLNTEAESQAGWGNLTADDSKLIGDKGWKSPLDVLKSYRELEKSAGTKVALPKADDAEGVGKLLRQLGVPEDASGYAIDDIRDIDKPFMDAFKETAKELNILPSQASGMYKWYREAQDKMAEQFVKQSKQDLEAVKSEWGSDYDKNEELMKRGWRMLELSDETLENIEVSIGTKAFMTLGKKLGDYISEDNVRGVGAHVEKSEAVSTEEFFKEILGKQQFD